MGALQRTFSHKTRFCGYHTSSFSRWKGFFSEPGYQRATGRKGGKRYEKNHVSGKIITYLAQNPELPNQDHAYSNVFTCIHPEPGCEDTVLIYPEVGGNGELLIDVIEDIIARGFERIQLAQFTKEQYRELCALMKRRRKSSFIQSIDFMVEEKLDWKFAQKIISVEKLAGLDGPMYKRLRKDIGGARKRVEKMGHKILSLDEFVREHGHDSLEINVSSNAMLWALSSRFEGSELAGVMDFYNNFSNLLSNPLPGLDGIFIVDKKNMPISSFVFEIDRYGTANALLGLTARSEIPNLHAYTMHQACEHLSEYGVEHLNLGGDETKSLEDYKLSLRPERLLRVYSYIVKPYTIPEIIKNLKDVSYRERLERTFFNPPKPVCRSPNS